MKQHAFTQEQLGSFSVSPTGSFEIATFQTFVLTVKAGSLGMDDKGSVRFVFHGAKDYSSPQTNDPGAPGYVTARTSGGQPVGVNWAPFLQERPWFNTLEAVLVAGGLAPDDEIIVTLGDRSGGSPGFRLQTNCQDQFKFRALVNPFSTQQFFELENMPSISIGPGPGHKWVAVLPTMRRPGQPFRLCLKCEDIWGNPSNRMDQILRFRPSAPIAHLPETARIGPGEFSLVIDDLTVQDDIAVTIDVLDETGQVLCRTNPLRIVDASGPLHFWGDLHGQSEETIGTNTARRYFEFARDKAFLDIASHQGNDFQITDRFWDALNRLTAELDEPGRFLAVPGYEWSGNTEVGGDRNVWYRSEGRPIRRAHRALVMETAAAGTDCFTARSLFDTLVGENEDVAVAAHCGGRYADIVQAHDGRVENSVEIHSAWGTFEWILRDALSQGYRVGIVANSDGHKGRPGASYPGDSFFTSMGGLTCFVMTDLHRDGLFEAMRRRHHYATTGARLYMSVRAQFEGDVKLYCRDPAVFGRDAAHDRASEAMMGDIVEVPRHGGSTTLSVDVTGSRPLERIDLFDGPELVETIYPNAPGPDGSRRYRLIWQGARYRGRGRNLRWDGEVRIADNIIEAFTPVNFWSPDNQPARVGDQQIAVCGLTAGNLQGLDLVFHTSGTGKLSFCSSQGDFVADLASIGNDGHVQTFDGLDTQAALVPVAEDASCCSATFHRQFAAREDGDLRLYVRVTQMDGHQAWSSPIYIFREPD